MIRHGSQHFTEEPNLGNARGRLYLHAFKPKTDKEEGHIRYCIVTAKRLFVCEARFRLTAPTKNCPSRTLPWRSVLQEGGPYEQGPPWRRHCWALSWKRRRCWTNWYFRTSRSRSDRGGSAGIDVLTAEETASEGLGLFFFWFFSQLSGTFGLHRVWWRGR